MLKNYTVRMEKVNVENYQKYIKYMYDNEHKNHLNTKIIKLDNDKNDVEDKIINTRNLINENENYKIKNKKAGRKIKTIFFSYTFNLPKNYSNASEEDLKNINKRILQSAAVFLQSIDENFEENEIEEYIMNCISSIHNQENNHLHVLFPTLTPSGKNLRRISQRNFLRMNKLMFTEIVDKVLKKDIKQYKTENISQYEIDLQRLIGELENDIKNMSNEKNIKFFNTMITYAKRVLNNKEDEKSLIHLNNRISKLNKSKSKKKYKQINI